MYPTYNQKIRQKENWMNVFFRKRVFRCGSGWSYGNFLRWVLFVVGMAGKKNNQHPICQDGFWLMIFSILSFFSSFFLGGRGITKRLRFFFHNHFILFREFSNRFLHEPGQIIATSHDRFAPKWWLSNGKSPKISGKPRLVKSYSIWPDEHFPIWWFLDMFYFHPEPSKRWFPFWLAYFFRWVGEKTTNQKNVPYVHHLPWNPGILWNPLMVVE